MKKQGQGRERREGKAEALIQNAGNTLLLGVVGTARAGTHSKWFTQTPD